MQRANKISTLIAARQALAEQQIRALRDWLGEDHELVARETSAPKLPLAAPKTRSIHRPRIHEEASA